jgi:N-acyl-D-aspartate/D-glutamate deacylase
MKPDDVRVIAAQPWVMTGSDGSTGHPRKYASFPKAFQDFARGEDPLFTTGQFVHRSAGLAADTFSLCDRGYLEKGRKADIVVLDLENFLPVADFQNPTELSTGVVHMLVNGAGHRRRAVQRRTAGRVDQQAAARLRLIQP